MPRLKGVLNCSIYSDSEVCAYCKSTHYLLNNVCIERSSGSASPSDCVAYELNETNCSLCVMGKFWNGTACLDNTSRSNGTGLSPTECLAFSRDGLSCLKCYKDIGNASFMLVNGLCQPIPSVTNCVDYSLNGDCICCDSSAYYLDAAS